MSGFITAGSQYNGAETLDIILRPIFIGKDPRELGVRVVFTKKAGSIKLNFFNKLTKILMPYASSWQGGSGATRKEKKFSLAEFKAEAAYSKQDYKSTILEQITNVGGVAQNDITGTDVMKAEQEVFQNALSYDIWRNWWLADTSKKHYAAGTYPDGSTTYVVGDEDKYYSTIDGIWVAIMAASVDYASSPTQDQITRITMSNAAVAQAETQTLASTSAGTITITVYGKDYSQAYATSVAATCTAWLATHGAAFAALKITVTDGLSADLTFTSSIAGKPFTLVMTDAGTSGTWTQSAVTANTAPAALTTDEAMTTFRLMDLHSKPELKEIPAEQKALFVTDTFYQNYLETLEDDGTAAAHFEVINGIKTLTWRGIPLIKMGIDSVLAADFVGEYPHRAILCPKNMLTLVLSEANDFAETRLWFNPDENQNRQRTQFEFGADYFLPELITDAY